MFLCFWCHASYLSSLQSTYPLDAVFLVGCLCQPQGEWGLPFFDYSDVACGILVAGSERLNLPAPAVANAVLTPRPPGPHTSSFLPKVTVLYPPLRTDTLWSSVHTRTGYIFQTLNFRAKISQELQVSVYSSLPVPTPKYLLRKQENSGCSGTKISRLC